MTPGFETPFPFCPSCATWHARGEHTKPSRYSIQRGRIGFAWGFAMGVAFASALWLLI